MTPRLRSYLHILAGNLDDAEDALQEVFVKYLGKGPPPGTKHAERWLFQVGRNHLLNLRRHEQRQRHRERAHDDMRLLASSTPSPSEKTIKAETVARIQKCLMRLSMELREALFLRTVEGFSYSRLATELGIAKSTASVRVQEALVQLARCFHRRQE